MKRFSPMRPALALGIALLASQPFVARNALAGPIKLSVETPPGSVSVGGLFDVDLRISGLNPEDLGGFDLELSFDPTVLQYQSYSLGTALNDPAVEQADLSDVSAAGMGVLQLAEVSWLFNLSGQPDDFSLATVTFLGEQRGVSSLTISYVDLSDDTGFGQLTVETLSNGSVAVPTPGSLILLPLGLAVLLTQRMKRRH